MNYDDDRGVWLSLMQSVIQIPNTKVESNAEWADLGLAEFRKRFPGPVPNHIRLGLQGVSPEALKAVVALGSPFKDGILKDPDGNFIQVSE